MPVKAALEFADEIGAISAYAYLGDVAQSVTGDKRAQSFEDSYLDELFSIISELGFRAVTYMPSRNTEEQLERKTELKTDLDTYTKELATQLILGQKSLDDWDSYMAELKDLGLDEILEIENDQLKRFNEAK